MGLDPGYCVWGDEGGPQREIRVIASQVVEGEPRVYLVDQELIVWQGGDRGPDGLSEVDSKREDKSWLKSLRVLPD